MTTITGIHNRVSFPLRFMTSYPLYYTSERLEFLYFISVYRFIFGDQLTCHYDPYPVVWAVGRSVSGFTHYLHLYVSGNRSSGSEKENPAKTMAPISHIPTRTSVLLTACCWTGVELLLGLRCFYGSSESSLPFGSSATHFHSLWVLPSNQQRIFSTFPLPMNLLLDAISSMTSFFGSLFWKLDAV